MRPSSQAILESLDDPERLEMMYRQDPASFRDAFAEASRIAPDSTAVRTWRARLDYNTPALGANRRRLALALGIGLIVGALIRLPAVWLGDEWYYPRLAPTLVILSLATYFWLLQRERRGLIVGLAFGAVATTWAVSLPGFSDSVVMALVHLPILAWAVLGYVFIGPSWREVEPRSRFLRYNGELLILASLVALGGVVFSGLTVALFGLATENAAEWYAENIGVMGVAAVPVVATYLYDVVFRRHTGIASVLARVFAPLFLIMTAIYMAVALLGGQNPFMDREFLIIVNGLLLVVLGMTVFSIVERGEGAAVGGMDYINVALLVVTLFIGLLAVAAMLFRLTSYGLTPNRVVVLGANLVIMTHLVWICRAYLGLFRGAGGVSVVHRAITGYLPVYVGWAVLVAFVLPLVFRFG